MSRTVESHLRDDASSRRISEFFESRSDGIGLRTKGIIVLTRTSSGTVMTTISTKPTYVSLHRLGELSGRSRATLLLRMRDGELVADATLDVGGRMQPLFVATRTDELKRLPLRKAAPILNPML
jgi:hypothetical protein